MPTRFSGQRTSLQTKIANLNKLRAEVVAAFNAVPSALSGIAAQAVQSQFQVIDEQVQSLRAQIDVSVAAEERALADVRSDMAAADKRLEALTTQSRQLKAAL